MKTFAAVLVFVGMAAASSARGEDVTQARPNILFCIADDWGWPDAGAYGAPVVKTPAFDRVAREGILFDNAFVTSPSCTPSRGSILTGQYHWRLGAGANLWSSLPPEHPVYPLLLEEVGYFVGHTRKAWGPGDVKALGRTRDPAGNRYQGFQRFLNARPSGKPFCFWLGSSDPHRPYERGSGRLSGMDPSKVRLPADLPDHPTVRDDVADYLLEVQRFDRDVGAALDLLAATGEAENTIVVITSDHGIPFPRHKCNVYDSGVHVPLAIRWPAVVKPGRRVTDFVSLADVAPTFIEAARESVPACMTGRSLMPIFRADGSGRIESVRDHVLVGRERHTPAQESPSMSGYPQRAIRTDEYLYITNLEPDRWPAGVPSGSTRGPFFSDCDDGPTKQLLLEGRDDPTIKRCYDLAFAKRPAEELFDLGKDPDQLVNVADDPAFAETKAKLSLKLREGLLASGDPRASGSGHDLESFPYLGPIPEVPAATNSGKKP